MVVAKLPYQGRTKRVSGGGEHPLLLGCLINQTKNIWLEKNLDFDTVDNWNWSLNCLINYYMEASYPAKRVKNCI